MKDFFKTVEIKTCDICKAQDDEFAPCNKCSAELINLKEYLDLLKGLPKNQNNNPKSERR